VAPTDELADALAAASGAAVESLRPVGGGDINEAFRAELADGRAVFVKTRAGAAAGEYEAEAAGLRWLGEGEIVRVPEVVAIGGGEEAAGGPAFLALAWVEPGRLSADGAEEFGRALAAMHALGAPAHAWLPGVEAGGRQRIGSLGLEATPGTEWAEVYARQRLLPLARMASEQGSLGPDGVAAVERVCERIAELAGPPEPPARLHGDLWSGNLHADERGRGWLIDPSAQGGHREMDLAMLRLFGAPSERIFAAYEETAPLAAGAAERVGLWQLQPLLVHAVLFGGHYGAAATRTAAGYA
jgi:fructosamine-3-kinase